MEAHLARWAILLAAFASLGASYRTPNFIVEAPSAQMAQQIGQAAETFRRDLAKEWLGTTMPNWAQPCPITAQVGDHLGAGGATSFVFEHGEVYGWRMSIQGSLVRISRLGTAARGDAHHLCHAFSAAAAPLGRRRSLHHGRTSQRKVKAANDVD